LIGQFPSQIGFCVDLRVPIEKGRNRALLLNVVLVLMMHP